MPRNNHRYTVYDMMEERGDFDTNPANINSRGEDGLPIYKKAEFPKMLYHPKGETVVTKPAEAVATPFGPKLVGEERRLVSKVVKDEEEFAAAKAEGWHERPGHAMAVAEGKPVPETPEDEVTRLRRELAEARAGQTPAILAAAEAAGAKIKVAESPHK